MDARHKLSKYINDIVSVYGNHTKYGYELRLKNLPEHVLNKLLFFKIEAVDREMDYVFFQPDETHQSDNVISSFMSLLLNDNKESRNNFINTILKNALDNYGEGLQELIDEECWDYQLEYYKENGFSSHIDKHSGTTEWRRSA